jgi:dienelactone hydrolase
MSLHPLPALRAFTLLAAALCALTCTTAHARLIEKIIKVPVKVTNAFGKVIEQEVVVSTYHDSDAPQPYPIALINHGRSVAPADRAAYGRQTAITNARWFAAMGFLVVVPTRIGYGVSGGEDVEDTGDCGNKNYPPGYEAAAAQTVQVLDAILQRPDVLPNRTLILGQSFGGATAITVAAKNPPGVVAAINFAGGGGGNPATQPQQPCAPHRLKRMFGDYGRSARIPTLWVYTENDQWMGPKYPREWFDAFKAEGGVGEFLLFPPNGKDGHYLFTQDPEVWRPKALAFLRANGYPELKANSQEAK